ncbi:MAG TPA: hypothetical protein VFP13_02160 [Actinomycetota bacterium]|nr:hypothetical protein [Actinomycetota bacterium]
MRTPRPPVRFALVALSLSVLASCSAQAGDASEANCPIEEGELFVLMAQSVPSATLLPCIAALPAGWSYGGSDVSDDGARFWLDSDRGGIHAVEVSLAISCRIGGAVEVTNSTSEGGVRVYLDEFTLHPFTANKYFVFPGGCVTYRYRFASDALPTLALEVDEAVTFGLRTVLVRQVREELGLTLCGASAPPCVGGA